MSRGALSHAARVLSVAALAAVAAGSLRSQSQCGDAASCAASLRRLAASSPATLAPALKAALPTLKSGMPTLTGTMFTAGLEELASALERSPVAGTDATYCPNSAAWDFVPGQVATLTTSAPTTTWPGDGCFTSMSASVSFNATGASVTISGTTASSLLCSDAYLVATSFNLKLVEVSALGASATTSMLWESNDEAMDVKLNGVQIFVLPCGLLGTVTSVLNTVGLFMGNGTDLQTNNFNFLVNRKVWDNVPTFGRVTALNASAIPSGSYLAIARFDGLDPMIMYMTGGTTGHSAIAVWEGNTLYVCESTDANPIGKVYWPPPYGIIRHEFGQWVALATAAGYHVAVLPLAPQYASKFDENAYWAWFRTVQGMPYGYHTMIFSLVDTYLPMQNFPLPATDAVLTVIMNYADRLLPNTTSGVSGYSMLVWGLNKRLNTECTTLACIIAKVNANKAAGAPLASFWEAAAVSDQDSWMFGANYSMVCSEFAAHGWKVGLGAAFPVWNNIQANEQTPKDNYQMALFDGTHFTNANCPGGVTTAAGGNGAYCQLMGPFQLLLPGYNSLSLYENMNSRCPSQWPSYERCPAGNPSCC